MLVLVSVSSRPLIARTYWNLPCGVRTTSSLVMLSRLVRKVALGMDGACDLLGAWSPGVVPTPAPTSASGSFIRSPPRGHSQGSRRSNATGLEDALQLQHSTPGGKRCAYQRSAFCLPHKPPVETLKTGGVLSFTSKKQKVLKGGPAVKPQNTALLLRGGRIISPLTQSARGTTTSTSPHAWMLLSASAARRVRPAAAAMLSSNSSMGSAAAVRGSRHHLGSLAAVPTRVPQRRDHLTRRCQNARPRCHGGGGPIASGEVPPVKHPRVYSSFTATPTHTLVFLTSASDEAGRRRRRSLVVMGAGGGGKNRPSWTEAAAGIGRGRTRGVPREGTPLSPTKGSESGAPLRAEGDDFSRKRRKQREAAAGEEGYDAGNDGFDSGGREWRPPVRGGGGGGEGSYRGRGGGARGGRGRGGGDLAQRGGRSGGRGGRGGENRYDGGYSSSPSSYAPPRSSSNYERNTPRSNADVTRRNVEALVSSGGDGDMGGEDYQAPFRAGKPRRGRGRSSGPEEGQSYRTVKYTGEGFRLVRCMPQLKRREADDAVSAGRVRVNGDLVRPSLRVRSGDVVTLDNKPMNWEPFAQACEADLGAAGSGFVYLKYNKPRGVTCTMEAAQRSSMLFALQVYLLT